MSIAESMRFRSVESAIVDVRLFGNRVAKARFCIIPHRQQPDLLPSDQRTFRQLRVRCSQLPRAITSSASLQNIFELGRSDHADLPISLSSLFSVASGSSNFEVF